MKIKICKVAALLCATAILMPHIARLPVNGGTEGLTHYVTVSKSGSNTYLPEGTSFMKFGCTFQNQGTHSEACEGYTTGAGRPSNPHNMQYTLEGHARITLYDRVTKSTAVLIDSYGVDEGGRLDLDPSHDYDVVLDAYGGTTIVTCSECGYAKKFEGSYTVFFEAWGNYAAQITSQPQDASGNCGDSVTFSVAGKCVTAYQWQMCINDLWTNIYDGALSSDGMSVSNCNRNTLTVSGLRSSINGTKVRCMVRGRDGNQVASNEARITAVDSSGPSVSVSKSTEDPVNGPVVLTVSASDADSGLADAPYSYNGSGYCASNTFEVSENSVVEVAVMDRAGNVTRESVSVTNIVTPEPSPAPSAPVPVVEPTKAPAEPTKAPVEPTKTPAEPTKTPAEPTKMPAEPTKTPVEPAQNTPTPAPTQTPVKPVSTPVPTKKPTLTPSVSVEVPSSGGGNSNNSSSSPAQSFPNSVSPGTDIGNQSDVIQGTILPSAGATPNDPSSQADSIASRAASAGGSSKGNQKTSTKNEKLDDEDENTQDNPDNREDPGELLVVRNSEELADEYAASPEEIDDEISLVTEDVNATIGNSGMKTLAVSGEVIKNREMSALTIALIVLAGIVVLLLLVYVLLLGVLILYEKEDDEDYSEKKKYALAGLSLLFYKEGVWSFKIKEELYELAPLTLKYGPIFTALFEGWDLQIKIKPTDEEEEPEVLSSVVYQNAVIK